MCGGFKGEEERHARNPTSCSAYLLTLLTRTRKQAASACEGGFKVIQPQNLRFKLKELNERIEK